MNTNDVIEWTHGPFSPVAVITHTGELIRMNEERRCSDVSDVADRTTDSADRSDLRSDAGVAGLISEDSRFDSIPLVRGGQGRSNYAALLSALIAVLCIGGMGLIVGVAVVSSIVRWILSR